LFFASSGGANGAPQVGRRLHLHQKPCAFTHDLDFGNLARIDACARPEHCPSARPQRSAGCHRRDGRSRADRACGRPPEQSVVPGWVEDRRGLACRAIRMTSAKPPVGWDERSRGPRSDPRGRARSFPPLGGKARPERPRASTTQEGQGRAQPARPVCVSLSWSPRASRMAGAPCPHCATMPFCSFSATG
jgi:hypothetical protein